MAGRQATTGRPQARHNKGHTKAIKKEREAT